jgi:hypothetical protein
MRPALNYLLLRYTLLKECKQYFQLFYIVEVSDYLPRGPVFPANANAFIVRRGKGYFLKEDDIPNPVSVSIEVNEAGIVFPLTPIGDDGLDPDSKHTGYGLSYGVPPRSFQVQLEYLQRNEVPLS